MVLVAIVGVTSLKPTVMAEAYNSTVKNKPGDFILRDKDIPVSLFLLE